MHSLYAVENAVSVPCRACGKPIDIWRPGGIIDWHSDPNPDVNRGTLQTRMDPESARCPECLMVAAPTDERESLARRFTRARIAAQAAGIPDWITTYPVAWEGDPKETSKVRGYLLTSYGTLIPGWVDGEGYQPSIVMDGLVDPDDPKERSISLVWFSVEIEHADVSSAFLRYSFSFRDLRQPPSMVIVGGFNPEVSESNLITLVKGRRMYGEVMRGGRPPGSTAWSREEFLDELPRVRQRLRVQNRRKPSDVELAAAMGIPLPTFNRYKKRFLSDSE